MEKKIKSGILTEPDVRIYRWIQTKNFLKTSWTQFRT